jgi:HTH-type transcriptional regulator/antitoxin HigA
MGNNDSSKISAPQTEAEYNRLVAMLDELIDEVGEDESHPLASLMEIIGVMIEYYENANVSELAA